MATIAAAAKVTRTRKPSSFAPRVKVTLNVHSESTADVTTTSLGASLKAFYEAQGAAVRVVSRSRKSATGKPSAGPSNLMVYIAPAGHTFAAVAERGVRLDSETAKMLRAFAEKMGLDPNDPASITAVARALVSKANA